MNIEEKLLPQQEEWREFLEKSRYALDKSQDLAERRELIKKIAFLQELSGNGKEALSLYKQGESENEGDEKIFFLLKQSRILRLYKDFDKALSLLYKADSLINKDTSEEVKAWVRFSLGETLADSFDREKALTFYLKARAIWERLEAEIELAMVVASSAKVYFEQGDIENARQRQEEVEAKLSKITSTSSLHTWKELENKANLAQVYTPLILLYFQQGKWHLSLMKLKEQLEILKQIGDLPRIADNLISQANLLYKSGESEKADKLIEEAKEIQGKVGLPYQISLAIALGWNLLKQGRIKEALRVLKDSKDLALAEAPFLYLELAFPLGEIYFVQGLWEEGKKLYTEVKDESDKLQNSRLLAIAFNRLASFYRAQEDYSTAYRFYLESQKHFRKINHLPGIADTFDNLGELYSEKGSWQVALECFQQSKNIRQRMGHLPSLGESYLKMARVLLNLREYEQSLGYFKKAHQLYQELQDLSGLAEVYTSEGFYFLSQRDIPSALQWAEKAEEIYNKLDEQEGLKEVLLLKGLIYYQQGEFVKSLASYQKAEEIAVRLGNVIVLPVIYEVKALIYMAEKDWHRAEEFYRKKIALEEQLGKQISLASSFNGLSKVYEERASELVSGREKPVAVSEVRLGELMVVEPLMIELGEGLLDMVTPISGAVLMEKIRDVRKQLTMELGVIIPGVKITDNRKLKYNEYTIKIREVKRGGGIVYPDRYLVIGKEEDLKTFMGKNTYVEFFSLPGIWIEEREIHKIEDKNVLLFDAATYISVHLQNLVRSFAWELLWREEVVFWLEELEKRYPFLVKEARENLSTGLIREVLQRLLQEGIPIKDGILILEAMLDSVPITKDVELITERVRIKLAPLISELFSDQGVLKVCIVDNDTEEIIAQAITEGEDGRFLALPKDLAFALLEATQSAANLMLSKGCRPIIVTSPRIRRFYRQFILKAFPQIIVISSEEIDSSFAVESLGTVSLGKIPTYKSALWEKFIIK